MKRKSTLEGMVAGHWFELPQGSGLPDLPSHDPPAAILFSKDRKRGLFLADVDDFWFPVSEAAIHTYNATHALDAGPRNGVAVVFVASERGTNPQAWQASRLERIDLKTLGERYGEEAARRARPEKQAIELRLEPFGPGRGVRSKDTRNVA